MADQIRSTALAGAEGGLNCLEKAIGLGVKTAEQARDKVVGGVNDEVMWHMNQGTDTHTNHPTSQCVGEGMPLGPELGVIRTLAPPVVVSRDA